MWHHQQSSNSKKIADEDKLIFTRVLDISLAPEAATEDTAQLQAAASATPGNPVAVYKVQEGEKTSPSIKCYRCGKPNHKAPECHYKDSICVNA